MKNGLTTLKRLLSLIMVFAMLITLLPPAVSAAGTTRTVYLKAGVWDTADAWFDAWVWGSGQADAWYTFVDEDADGVYSAEIPADATGMKILRKDPANKEHSWNSWNDSGDLTISSTENCYEITGWGSGKWTTFTYVAPTYTVAGEAGLCGTGWDVSDTSNDMTKNGSGLYEKVYTNVAAGTYQFKIVRNHSWDKSWGNGSDNASVTAAVSGSTVTISFDPAAGAITTQVVEPVVEYTVTFNGTNVTSDGADTVEEGKDYTSTLTAEEGYILPETVEVTVGGNAVTPAYDAVSGELTVTGVTGDVVITAVGVKAAPETRTIYLKAGVWDTADAWFDAWVWGSGQADAWYTFVDEDADGVYSAEIPADATGMKILRKDPANKEHSWNSWNDSGDLTISSTENCYEITGWGSGKWTTFIYVAPVYTVAGEAGLCGTGWDVSDTSNDMVKNGSGLYEKVYTNVAAGTYQFKIVRNHSWDKSWGNGSDNASVTVAVSGSTVTISFDPAAGAITTQVVEPAPETITIYLKAGVWDVDGAWMVAEVGADRYRMTDGNLDGIYEVELPADAASIKFYRMANNTTSVTGTSWNESGTVTISSAYNCYEITGWGSSAVCPGKWVNITPSTADAVLTVAGEAGLCGTAWDVSNTANDMTRNASGLYEKVYTNVAAGTYQFKVAANHSWTNSWGNGSGNASVTVAASGSTVTITFDVDTKKVAADVTAPAAVEHSVTFNGTNVTSDGASTVEDGADYTATLTPDEGYKLPETVEVTVGGNAVTPDYDAATGMLTVAAVTGDVVITVAGVPEDDGMITVYFRNDWLWPEVYIYYTAAGADVSWPGEKMTRIDTVASEFGDRDVYAARIPAGADLIIFNGLENGNASNRQQTPDITDFQDGDAFYIYWDNGNAVAKFTYPENGGDAGDTTGDVSYEATFHFVNTLNWGAVNLYTWTEGGTTLTGGWPGSAVSQDGDGLYTMTVKYTAPANQGLNFIFNNGGTQTVDLALSADDFDSNHKAEKWVILTTQTDGKYNADILDNGNSIAISPIVRDNDVTFQYKAPDAASVEVRGTMLGDDGWSTGAAMTKNEHGIWSVTLEDVVPGVHEYKFIVDGSWITDPANSWTENGNSAFLISDSEKDINTVTVRVHYTRSDNNYDNWNVYMWNSNGTGQYDFTVGEGEALATIVVEGRATQDVNFKIRKSVGSNKWAAEESQVTVNLSKIVSGTIDVFYSNGSSTQKMGDDVVYGNKVSSVELDYENNVITITTSQTVTDASTAFTLVNTTDAGDAAAMTYNADKSSGSTYAYDVSGNLDLVTLYQYKVRFNEDRKFPDALYDIGINNVYATERFAEEFTYQGDDLGANWTAGATRFVVWAPTAESAHVNIYTSGTQGTDDLEKTVKMEKGRNGTWTAAVEGNLNGKYYTYSVKVNGETVEAVDPYARTAGVNGNRGMVIDLASTDPADGWSEMAEKPASYNDAVIYELHVRDFSIDDSSGVKEAWRGKFLGLTQSGTTTAAGTTTGLDYLVDLGITHLHLLPIYDYASVDESALGTPQFNWGYDPQNYNIPEGSYSTDPYHGEVRVQEMKEMVDVLHENGIGVVMDVVYNHVYDAGTFCFNQIVPGYFSRPNSNTSGCGNDTASEREMVRKYIVDSVVYWADEYHLDGFRFDLVGLIDTQTINEIVTEVHKIRPHIIFYGEGWDMDGTNKEPGTEMAKQGNASKTPGFAYFSDNMRNLLAGDNGKSTGFVSGASGQESGLVSNYMANPWWTNNPNQVVQYVSCHDNHTLVDKLIKSTGRSKLDSTVIRMNNLAAAVYMTSQGIPFIHAGEEMLREKLDVNGNRVENSYNAPDFVNHIEWSNLDSTAFDYAGNAAYYKGLIEFRKAHPALSLDSAADVTAKVLNQQSAGNLVTFWIDAREVAGENHDSIYVIFNANSSARNVELPEGDWDVCVNGTKAGTEVIETVSGTVSVEGISALILVQEESTQEPTPPAAKSQVALPGSFNGWNTSNFMEFVEDSTTMTTQTLSLPAGTYTFKVKIGDTWYGNNGTIADTTGAEGWVMDASAGDCTLNATGGAYTFLFDTTTNQLVVSYDPNGGEFGKPEDYYLCGYINGVDYAMGVETGEYKFDEQGKLTATFTADSYVVVKNGDASEKYMTKGWLGSVTEAVMYPVSDWGQQGYDKLMVPGGNEVTFTLAHNDDGTVTLRYEIQVPAVEDFSGVQDGLTLHCWNWSFAQIEANMAAIAEQGYTAIQTSPVQPLKEATSDKAVGTNWWVYYQPIDFVISTAEGNALGTKEDLESMIAAAHRYGIQVIVDVVANHLANETGNNLSPEIPEYLRRQDFWHDITRNTNDWNNRFEVTQYCMAGLPDLNTGNSELQQIVLDFLKACVDAGVDGFRFDAAKSIETPDDDPAYASDFWPTVVGGAETYAQDTYGKDLYIYGEVLDTTGGVALSAYTKYMAITDNSWGNSLRGNIASGNAALAAGYNKAVDASVLVLWAESHDTYATDDANQSSAGVSEEDIIKTWALVAARADAMGLYFARPVSNAQLLGVASVTGWAKEEVKAINLFHNAFIGQSEIVSNENGISYVERGTTGAVLVAAADTTGAEVSVTAHAMADGEYVDQITGNTFTVADGKITGEIGSTGIAVVYNAAEAAKYTIEVAETTGGTVAADKETAEQGETVTLTVQPAEGNVVDTVTVTDAQGSKIAVTDKGDGIYTFTQPNSDVTVAVTFKARETTEPDEPEIPDEPDIPDGPETPDEPEDVHQITVNPSVSGRTEVSDEAPETGDTVTVTPNPDEGVAVEKVVVRDAAGNEIKVTDNGDGTYSFVQPDCDVTIVVTYKPDYKITKGDGSSVQEDSSLDLTFTANGAFAKFTGIKVDGKTVDTKHYTVREGSTIITLKAAYLKTLKTGKHTITVLYTDGETEGTFHVTRAAGGSTTPTTGDGSQPALWLGLMTLSALAFVSLMMEQRRRTFKS